MSPSYDIRRHRGLVHLSCTCGFSNAHQTLSDALASLAAHNAWHMAQDGQPTVAHRWWGARLLTSVVHRKLWWSRLASWLRQPLV